MQKRVPKSKNIAISELKDVTRDGLLGHYENIAIAERIRRAEKRKIGILSNHMVSSPFWIFFFSSFSFIQIEGGMVLRNYGQIWNQGSVSTTPFVGHFITSS